MEQKWHTPIELLKPDVHNLLNHISGQLRPDLQDLIMKSGISFLYDNEPLPIKTPKGELETYKIRLQDTHMEYLWCCCYITVALYSMQYEQSMIDNDIVQLGKKIDFPKVARTLDWARSLRTEVSHWPDDTGRPDVKDRWTEAATNLYKPCVAYLMFHEIGHEILHQNLLDVATARLNPLYVLTTEAKKRLYDAEVEADQFALDCLMSNSTIDDIRMIKYLGAILGQLSNFFMLDVPDTRGGNTHPDLDVRLRNILKQVDLTTEAARIYLDAHVSLGLQLFFKITGKDIIEELGTVPNFKDFVDLHEYLFSLIDKMKNAVL